MIKFLMCFMVAVLFFGCTKISVDIKAFEECQKKCETNQGMKEIYDGLYYQCACNNTAHFPLYNKIIND